MSTTKTITFWCLALALSLSQLPAQMGGGDPSKEIKEIAESINKQLKEIDELLLESGRKGQTRNRPKELLEKASEGSATVQDGIEKLIEKLTEMKNQSSSSQQSSQQPSQPQEGQQPGQPQQGQSGQSRRENQTPDFVQQPQEGEPQKQQGEQEGQQPGEQQQQDGKPKGGQESKDVGTNKSGNTSPNSATGPGKPGTGQSTWGDLQPYLNFLKNRGASPKVPTKFRKYYEAYLKSKGRGGK